jgi:hypothetical protein
MRLAMIGRRGSLFGRAFFMRPFGARDTAKAIDWREPESTQITPVTSRRKTPAPIRLRPFQHSRICPTLCCLAIPCLLPV